MTGYFKIFLKSSPILAKSFNFFYSFSVYFSNAGQTFPGSLILKLQFEFAVQTTTLRWNVDLKSMGIGP